MVAALGDKAVESHVASGAVQVEADLAALEQVDEDAFGPAGGGRSSRPNDDYRSCDPCLRIASRSPHNVGLTMKHARHHDCKCCGIGHLGGDFAAIGSLCATADRAVACGERPLINARASSRIVA